MGEIRTVLSLAFILSFRMLGLFMIYPIFALYAPGFNHATATLIGIALGIYGLTQALLQLPLSMLSDRIGRKPVITGGLLIFALGSIVSALTHNIYLLILGRALQGSGAIGSTLIAYASDLTSVENRTKAMAILGMTIGASFALAMVLGPLFNAWLHLSGIFWFTGALALLGIVIQYYFIPTKKIVAPKSGEPIIKTIKMLLFRTDLLKLNLSILLLHALLTASFVIIPLLFSNIGIATKEAWKVYLPILLGAFIVTFPILIFSEKKRCIKLTLLFAILLLGLAEFLFSTHILDKWSISTALFIFFTGFTLLETMLPSLISKIAPPEHKGSAMGLYSTFQFLGIFLGGAGAGMIRNYYNPMFIFYCCIILCLSWFIYLASASFQFSHKDK